MILLSDPLLALLLGVVLGAVAMLLCGLWLWRRAATATLRPLIDEQLALSEARQREATTSVARRGPLSPRPCI